LLHPSLVCCSLLSVQACLAAAVPYSENVCCCAKHVRIRELQELDGKTFSRINVDAAEEYLCMEVSA
jgi:hypothetical protein